MKILLVFVIAFGLLVACSPSSTVTPNTLPTTTPTPTIAIPTATVAPTYTPVARTLTPMPSAATATPIVLASLNPYLTGVGEHGAIVCLKPVNPSQLDRLVINANISQAGNIVERNVPAQDMGVNGRCIEIVDAMYQLGAPVNVELNATANGKTVENGKQVVDVGDYGLLDAAGKRMPYPFIYPIFSYSDVPTGTRFTDSNHATKPTDGKYQYAHDLWFGNGIQGVPIYVPFTLNASAVEMAYDENQQPTNWRVIGVSPFTGFTCMFQHITVTDNSTATLSAASAKNADQASTLTRKGKGYTIPYSDASGIMAVIGPQDRYSGLPHLHFECQNQNLKTGPGIAPGFMWKGIYFGTRTESQSLLPNTINFEILPYLISGWIK